MLIYILKQKKNKNMVTNMVNGRSTTKTDGLKKKKTLKMKIKPVYGHPTIKMGKRTENGHSTMRMDN